MSAAISGGACVVSGISASGRPAAGLNGRLRQSVVRKAGRLGCGRAACAPGVRQDQLKSTEVEEDAPVSVMYPPSACPFPSAEEEGDREGLAQEEGALAVEGSPISSADTAWSD